MTRTRDRHGPVLDPLAWAFLSEMAAQGRSRRTIDEYRVILSAWTRFRTDTGMDESRLTVRAYLHHLHERGLKASSRGTALAVLRSSYDWRRKYHGLADPTLGIPSPILPKRLPAYLTPEECATLCADTLGPR